MRPPGPSTHTSSTGTDPGDFMPGGSRTTLPVVERTVEGSAEEDQRYSTLPSGRAVAPETEPAGVGTLTRSRVARS